MNSLEANEIVERTKAAEIEELELILKSVPDHMLIAEYERRHVLLLDMINKMRGIMKT